MLLGIFIGALIGLLIGKYLLGAPRKLAEADEMMRTARRSRSITAPRMVSDEAIRSANRRRGAGERKP